MGSRYLAMLYRLRRQLQHGTFKGTKAVGAKLCDLAAVVRSKNAGVNEITFDLIFTEIRIRKCKSKSCTGQSVLKNCLGAVLGSTAMIRPWQSKLRAIV